MSNNKQTMKLYTEEQMHTVMLLALGKYQIHSNKKVLKHNQELLDSLTPIELPGHFEILDEARKEESSKEQYAFIRAVRWISNKIGYVRWLSNDWKLINDLLKKNKKPVEQKQRQKLNLEK